MHEEAPRDGKSDFMAVAAATINLFCHVRVPSSTAVACALTIMLAVINYVRFGS